MVVKNRVFLIAISVIVSLLGSCDDEKFPYDEAALTYKGEFVFENQFLIEGAYISDFGLRYFYENGTYYSEGVDSDSFGQECYQIKSGVGDIPYAWGYYIIDGDTLKVQTYDPGSLNRYCEYKVEERWAIIENESTLRFFLYKAPNGDHKDINRTYSFRQCSNKPDSTNILMDYN